MHILGESPNCQGLEGELDALLQIPQGPRSPSSHAEVSAGRSPELQRRDGVSAALVGTSGNI